MKTNNESFAQKLKSKAREFGRTLRMSPFVAKTN